MKIIVSSISVLVFQITYSESVSHESYDDQRNVQISEFPCGPQSDELIGSEEAIGARNATLEMEEKFSPRIRMSGTTIRPKEAILVILALALLVFSIMLFYKHWSKNYRELNTLPYYAYLYKEPPETPPQALSGSCMIPVGSQSDLENPLSRTPSSRLLSRSRHSSFRTCSMDPMDPAGGSLRGTLRLKSFKRNRPSFIHVTAEAMQRQKSLRIHNNPWEFQNQRKNRRRTVPTRLPPNAELQRQRSSLETIFTEDQNDIKPHVDSIQDQVIHEIELKTFSEENIENSGEDSILKEGSMEGEEQENNINKHQVFVDRHTATVI